mmetsp:Transcript_11392/g.20693  ORF Transcript_11392/g.20693 Transcript_11392/m.20693 type:complete len:82 (-) Transcript_11392:699-944(-)
MFFLVAGMWIPSCKKAPLRDSLVVVGFMASGDGVTTTCCVDSNGRWRKRGSKNPHHIRVHPNESLCNHSSIGNQFVVLPAC